jgi:hypothetical protein
MLMSSIFGKEFIRYRKNTSEMERKRFSKKAKENGGGMIPIVIDSVDKEMSDIFISKETSINTRIITYGLCKEVRYDAIIEDIIKEVKVVMIRKNKEYLFMEGKLKVGLENGEIIENQKTRIIDIYKKHKNEKDDILYLLITRESSVYNYIMSIIRSLISKIF